MVMAGTIPKSGAKVRFFFDICKYFCIFLQKKCIFLHFSGDLRLDPLVDLNPDPRKTHPSATPKPSHPTTPSPPHRHRSGLAGVRQPPAAGRPFGTPFAPPNVASIHYRSSRQVRSAVGALASGKPIVVVLSRRMASRATH